LEGAGLLQALRLEPEGPGPERRSIQDRRPEHVGRHPSGGGFDLLDPNRRGDAALGHGCVLGVSSRRSRGGGPGRAARRASAGPWWPSPIQRPATPAFAASEIGGRNRSRTCDLFLVMEALVPTELCARRSPAIIPALSRSLKGWAAPAGCDGRPAPR